MIKIDPRSSTPIYEQIELGIKELILKGIICAFIPNIIYLIIYFKTKIFKESLSIIKK